MKDKQLESNIKNTEEFLEYWVKFNQIYKDSISVRQDSVAVKDIFFSTKEIVNNRFEDFLDSIGITHKQRVDRYFGIYRILSIKDLDIMSDEKIDQIKEDWTESFILLYDQLKRFKRKKLRIENINGIFFKINKFLNKGGKK